VLTVNASEAFLAAATLYLKVVDLAADELQAFVPTTVMVELVVDKVPITPEKSTVIVFVP
jgi:hypothetical protein